MSEENQPELGTKIKSRIDYRFYSNVTNVTVTGSDAYIDFMQYPPEDGEVPVVRVYLSHVHLKNLREVLNRLPHVENEKNEL